MESLVAVSCKYCIHYGVCRYRITEKTDFTVNECNNFKNIFNISEIKHGTWYVEKFPRANKIFITCSECRSVIDCDVTCADENEYDFCPYCGAKMRD